MSYIIIILQNRNFPYTRLTMRLFIPGGPGDKGLAALPNREAEFKTALLTALDYAVALKCPR